MVRLVVLLVFACQVVVAQDQPAAVDPADSNDLFAPLNSKQSSPEQPPEKNAKKTDWKPKLSITLITSPQGQNVVQTIVRTVPTYSTAYKEIKTMRGDETFTVRVPMQKLESREVSEQVMVPGTAIVLCDALDMAVEATESGPQYSFSSKGPMILQYRSSAIRAETGTYSNGELKLTKATVTQAGLTMESESLVVKMTVYGLSTAPQSPTPDRDLYRPSEPFDPDAFGRSRGNDDWAPHPDRQMTPVPDRNFQPPNDRRLDSDPQPLGVDAADPVPQPRPRDREENVRQPPASFDDFAPQQPTPQEVLPAPRKGTQS